LKYMMAPFLAPGYRKGAIMYLGNYDLLVLDLGLPGTSP